MKSSSPNISQEDKNKKSNITDDKKYGEAQFSPTRKPLQLILSLPTRSPSKRGVIKLESDVVSSKLLSPLRTPKGRAGLPSPQKRSSAELEGSARKRAVRTRASSKLLSDFDNEIEFEDPLELQDQRIADAIIGHRSQKEAASQTSSKPYGSDIELEEDLTEVKRPRRGRPRKSQQNGTTSRQKKMDTSLGKISTKQEKEVGNAEEESDLDDQEFTPTKRRKRRSAIKSLSKEKELLSEGEEFYTPRSYEGTSKLASPTPRKVGRPSNKDKLAGKVKSIFQVDDEFFFAENRSSPKERSSSEKDSSKIKGDNLSSALEDLADTTALTIPVISGSPEVNSSAPADALNKYKFTPMPIPHVNEEDEIQDKDFLERFFPNTNLDSKKKDAFVDERAFFLEGSEGYFEQHMGRPKASNNSLSQLAPPLGYEEFIPYSHLSGYVLHKEKNELGKLHQSLYHQWCFELAYGFSLNFYGIGSKIKVILDFIENYFISWYEEKMQIEDKFPEILIVNGYNSAVKFKRVLHDIVSVFIPPEKAKQENINFPKHVSETVPFLVNFLEQKRTSNEDVIRPQLILVIHNIDGESFRSDKVQSLLSRLCSVPEIWLISSTDNINVSLLWDLSKLNNYNFVWHDLSTYEPYFVELSFKDVLNTGKSKKFVGVKGAQHVLNSLTSNAKMIYKILLAKQLDILKNMPTTKSGGAGSLKGSPKSAVDFKDLYKTCLEEFVTSNEVTFRTMLREFIEHKMCILTRNEFGVESVYISFTFEEMQSLYSEEFASSI